MDWGKHQHRWQSYPGLRQAKKLVLGPSNALSSSLLKLDRRGIRKVVALISEHGHFRKHLCKVGLYKEEPTCRICKQDEETASHVLFDCPALERKRHTLSISREDLGKEADIGTKILQLVQGTDFGKQ